MENENDKNENPGCGKSDKSEHSGKQCTKEVRIDIPPEETSDIRSGSNLASNGMVTDENSTQANFERRQVAGQENFDDNDNISKADLHVQHAFVLKVFTIVGLQLLFTTGFTALFLFYQPLKVYVYQHPIIVILSTIIVMAILFIFCCFRVVARKPPFNYILLAVFTVAESVSVAVVTSIYELDVILIAFGSSCAIVLVLGLFAIQTKYSFVSWIPYMLVAVVVLLIFSIVLIFWQNTIAILIYCFLGLIVFSLFLIIDIQMLLLGKHRITFEKEDYVIAALNIYIDILMIFLYLLRIIGILDQ